MLDGLDNYFGDANFESLELLERVAIPTILHSLRGEDDFCMVGGRLVPESENESGAWSRDLNVLQARIHMTDTMTSALRRERTAWRTNLILMQLSDVKKSIRFDVDVNVSAGALLAAVKNFGSLQHECPNHYHLLEAVTATMLTSVSPERGFSWLKRFLTRLSQGMRPEVLDDCMQVAMNAPPDGNDDEWCNQVVEVRFDPQP